MPSFRTWNATVSILRRVLLHMSCFSVHVGRWRERLSIFMCTRILESIIVFHATGVPRLRRGQADRVRHHVCSERTMSSPLPLLSSPVLLPLPGRCCWVGAVGLVPVAHSARRLFLKAAVSAFFEERNARARASKLFLGPLSLDTA